jgi:hypothetical protein
MGVGAAKKAGPKDRFAAYPAAICLVLRVAAFKMD